MTKTMDAPVNETPKLSDMVMCGDHPSLKNELSPKDVKDTKEKEKLKDKSMQHAKITPSISRTGALLESRARIFSEHALRPHETHRRMRSGERDRPEGPTTNRPIVQGIPWVALGSFRWPPYLLAVWVLVLILTHALHCLVSGLERALPTIKQCSQYFKSWTLDSWKSEAVINHHKLYPIGLALLTALLYTVYFGLYAVYTVAVWSIEPLNSDLEVNRSSVDIEAKVTDYVDNTNSKTNASIKQE